MLLVWRADSSDSCDDVYQCSGSGSHHVEAAPCCGGSRNRPFLGAVVRFLGAGIASTRESLAVVPIVDLVFCFLFASTLLSLYFECVVCSFWPVDVVFLGLIFLSLIGRIRSRRSIGRGIHRHRARGQGALQRHTGLVQGEGEGVAGKVSCGRQARSQGLSPAGLDWRGGCGQDAPVVHGVPLVPQQCCWPSLLQVEPGCRKGGNSMRAQPGGAAGEKARSFPSATGRGCGF